MNDVPSSPRRRALPALALACAVAALAIALFNWGSLRAGDQRLQALEQDTAARLAENAQRADTLTAQDRQLGETLAALSAGQDATSKRLDNLYGKRRSGLLAAEAEHLVRLAAQRLALMQDPAGALALLTTADAAIREIRDVDTHAARAALAADMAPLRAAGSVDIEAIYLRLAALPAQIDAIAGTDHDAPPPPLPPAGEAPAGTAWDRLVQTLSTLVTVRRMDVPAEPVVAPGERALAAQHFRMLIDQAQLALLQRRPGIYGESLAQADRWLARLVGGDAARRNAVHRELSSLRALDIGPRLPDLTGTLAATRELAARLLPETGDTP